MGQYHRHLYNLREDLGETHNLAAEQSERVAALRTKLDGFLSDTGAVLPKPNPAYDATADVEIAGWRPAHDAGLRAERTHAVLRSTGNDPQMTTSLQPAVPGPLRIEIRMKSSSRGAAAVYWARGNQNYHRERGVFFTPQHDGQWHDYRLELPAAGPVASLRFDPSSAVGDICIEQIRLFSAEGKELRAWTFGEAR